METIEERIEDEARFAFWQSAMVKQHNPEHIKNWITGMFEFSDVCRGKVGDVTIINLKADSTEFGDTTITLFEYLSYVFMVEKIEKKGIYTNIFFRRDFFSLALDYIIHHDTAPR